MLFLASGQIKLYPIPEVEEVRDTMNRLVREGRPLLISQFIQGGTVPDWAKKQALERLSFGGQPDDLDPLTQIAWYDTDYEANMHGWDAETKKQVEDHLFNAQDQTFFFCEKPKAVAPWPNYPKLVVQGQRTIDKIVATILAKIEEDGYEPSVVAEYERDHLNRLPVIEALEALGKVAEEPTEVVVAA